MPPDDGADETGPKSNEDALPAANPISISEDQDMLTGIDKQSWNWTVTSGHTRASFDARIVGPAEGVDPLIQDYCFVLRIEGGQRQDFDSRCPSGNAVSLTMNSGPLVLHERSDVIAGEWSVSFSAEPGVGRFQLDVDVA